MQFAMRDLRGPHGRCYRSGMSMPALDLRRKTATVAILVAVGALAGPFGTYDDLSFAARLLYWSLAILGCGAIMEALLLAALSHPLYGLPAAARLAAAVLVGSFPAALVILALEGTLRGYPPTPGFALRVWGLVFVVALLVSLVEYRGALRGAPPRGRPGQEQAAPAGAQAAPGALFFRSLDPALGRDLISLSKQDHYLEVVTRQGSALILKRMADAVAELDGYPGLRIHRSHWVAKDALREIDRESGRTVVRLDDGRLLPVSRPYVARLRAELPVG